MNRQLAGSSELLILSWRVFRNSFWVNLVLGLLIIEPFATIRWLYQNHYINNIDISHQNYSINLIGGLILLFFLALIISSIANITLISYIHNRATENNKDLFWAFGNGFDKLFSFWWIAILASLWTLGGFLLLIIPGFIVATRLSLTSYVLVVENQYGLDALVKSRSLVRGYTFATLIRWIVPYLPLIIFGLIGYFLRQFLPKTNDVIYEAVNVLTASFATIYGYFLYKELTSLHN